MKRFSALLTLMVLAITATTFTSCDETTDNYANNIIGTWEAVEPGDLDVERLTFNTDQTGTLTEIEDGLESSIPFTYQIFNEKVTLEYYIIPGAVTARESFFILSLTATELTISDGDDDTMVWKRIK